MHILAGLDKPTSGTVTIAGIEITGLSDAKLTLLRREHIGFVFQFFNLLPMLNAEENVVLPLSIAGEKPDKEWLDSLLDQMGLANRRSHRPAELSGGQQQRVAIARALVYNPPVILLDEPLSNLDAKLREEARAWLRELIVSLGLSALCVTHDQTEAMAMSDRILLLRNGRIEQEGTPAELYGAPRSLYTAEFMGSNNRIEARVAAVDGEHVTLAGDGWQLQAQAREALTAGQHAQAVIRLERVQVADGPGTNRLEAELVTSMYLGDRWEYLFHCGDLRLRAFGHVPRAAGRHWIEFPANDCWAFAQAS
jgi:iron(III) transport system ATP-binding protein